MNGSDPETGARQAEDLDLPAIPGYRIVERIGRGSQADVYRAVQVKLAREVALKVLLPAYAADREYARQLVREARAAARLSHENIVAIYDVGVHGRWCFFSMEYVEGNSLDRLLSRGGPMDEKRVLNVALQVARALDHAWSFGIVHRDVKPSNILINSRSVVKLCDLGFARGVIEEGEKRAKGLTVGTPNYISPEQAQGLERADIRSDVYSLGATAYHAVTGAPPFSGSSPAEIMAMHMAHSPLPPRKRVPSLGAATAYFIERMMEKDASRRYDPAGLIRDLEAYMMGRFQIPAGSFSDSSLSLLAQEPGRGEERRVSLAPKRRRRRGGLRRQGRRR